jgi:hypothetical protein
MGITIRNARNSLRAPLKYRIGIKNIYRMILYNNLGFFDNTMDIDSIKIRAIN